MGLSANESSGTLLAVQQMMSKGVVSAEEGPSPLARGSRQAWPTPLRAAYSEAFEAWKDGAGQDALRRKLQIAQREKNRYFANRIAQTELARAHQARVAAEFMADETIDVLEVRINPRHPRADICDVQHARANLFGLGPGCYPKARTPRPPYHSFCWCRVRSRLDLEAVGAREVPGGEVAYLRSLSPDEAGRVMGSKARAARVMDGASVEAVTNAGKDPT